MSLLLFTVPEWSVAAAVAAACRSTRPADRAADQKAVAVAGTVAASEPPWQAGKCDSLAQRQRQGQDKEGRARLQ